METDCTALYDPTLQIGDAYVAAYREQYDKCIKNPNFTCTFTFPRKSCTCDTASGKNTFVQPYGSTAEALDFLGSNCRLNRGSERSELVVCESPPLYPASQSSTFTTPYYRTYVTDGELACLMNNADKTVRGYDCAEKISKSSDAEPQAYSCHLLSAGNRGSRADTYAYSPPDTSTDGDLLGYDCEANPDAGNSDPNKRMLCRSGPQGTPKYAVMKYRGYLNEGEKTAAEAKARQAAFAPTSGAAAAGSDASAASDEKVLNAGALLVTQIGSELAELKKTVATIFGSPGSTAGSRDAWLSDARDALGRMQHDYGLLEVGAGELKTDAGKRKYVSMLKEASEAYNEGKQAYLGASSSGSVSTGKSAAGSTQETGGGILSSLGLGSLGTTQLLAIGGAAVVLVILATKS